MAFVSVSTLRQLCDDASESVLIENNVVTPDWATPLLSMTTESLPSSQELSQH